MDETQPTQTKEDRRRALNLERVKRYYQKNKDKIIAKAKQRYQADPQKAIDYQKARYEAFKKSGKPRIRNEDPQKRRDRDIVYRAANGERLRAEKKEDRKANPEKYRLLQERSWLKSHYGLTIEARDEMIKSQNSRCLCCKTLFGILRETKPCVDHCHATGQVRGILCARCNFTLGHAADDPHILRACARYLERFKRTLP